MESSIGIERRLGRSAESGQFRRVDDDVDALDASRVDLERRPSRDGGPVTHHEARLAVHPHRLDGRAAAHTSGDPTRNRLTRLDPDDGTPRHVLIGATVADER